MVAKELAGTNNDTQGLKLVVVAGYLSVLITIAFAWSLREQQLIRAEQGIGYWLGIIGSILMLLLLVYPLRKRMRSLRMLGSVRLWFQSHMLFGVLGPVLVLIHSNFNLGSLNGRVALFCTLIVASSGIVGRYLYAKIHYGMYGHRATLESLQADVTEESAATKRQFSPVELINDCLAPHERRVLERSRKIIPSVFAAIFASLTSARLKRQLKKKLRREIESRSAQSAVFAAHRKKLTESANQYLDSRLSTYRKFVQLSGCERLFGLWHVVHFPLFMVMVLAAIVHIIAVHAY
jgi:hypothetical protein